MLGNLDVSGYEMSHCCLLQNLQCPGYQRYCLGYFFCPCPSTDKTVSKMLLHNYCVARGNHIKCLCHRNDRTVKGYNSLQQCALYVLIKLRILYWHQCVLNGSLTLSFSLISFHLQSFVTKKVTIKCALVDLFMLLSSQIIFVKKTNIYSCISTYKNNHKLTASEARSCFILIFNATDVGKNPIKCVLGVVIMVRGWHIKLV